MLDRYNRKINYLRISVTDRCNLRCVYCMPAEGVPMMRHEDILRYDEIAAVTRVAADMGVDKVRITGGEPLVRRGITGLVQMLSAIPGIRDLSMTTNGILLNQFAAILKQAGLMRVNISMDTTDPGEYRMITRGGDITLLFSGIDAALQAGLSPVKINCVIRESVEEGNARLVRDYCEKKGLEIRYIYEMNLDSGFFRPVIGGDGGNCSMCNRLRLTSNGLIKPCLFSDSGYPVRELGPHRAIELALAHKPACGGVNTKEEFYNLGG